MIKKIAYRLFGLILLLISALTWFWMLVGFEMFFSAKVIAELGRDAEWLHPGALGMPVVFSIVTALVGSWLLTAAVSTFPRATSVADPVAATEAD